MKKLSKVLAVALAIAVIAVTFVACSGGSTEKEKLSLATSADFPPYEYIGDNGAYAGIDIEIAQAIELAYPNRKVKKVRTVYMPSHQKRLGMKFGRTQSGKKAIVTIEGDPIEELTGV